ncbi:e9imm peptide [Streptomyces sp. NPDC006670]|uniref:e9imm peptide n=1 Tax=Streptomyces sp. NPDC006670 TaxID=3154476 RepID=UPI0034031406
MTREEAVHLAQQILDGTITSEAEVDAALDALYLGLRCPHIVNYIYWDFAPELSADKIVDRAMSYQPFAL